MNDPTTCPRAAGLSCEPAGPITLQEARERFRREAKPGACDTSRYRCPYFSWGDGPPLVIVHGLSDAARSFILLVTRLCAHFRCIAYDLPRGGSDGAWLGSYTHADLVDDLFALLDHLGIRQSYLLGSSFGSTVVLAALRRGLPHVRRVEIAGCGHFPHLTHPEVLAELLHQFLTPPREAADEARPPTAPR
jgi:pimeloyl-ACP methyl ester carboxylesterase